MVEVSVGLSLSVLVLGVLLRYWSLTAAREPGPFVTIAWSLALWQVIAWPCMIISSGLMLSEGMVAGVLGAGILVGFAYAFWSLRACASHTSCSPLTNTTNKPVTINEKHRDKKKNPMSALFCFVVGGVVGLLLTYAIVSAAVTWGPDPVVDEPGFHQYAKEHKLRMSLVTGFGLLSSGWMLAFILHRFKAPSGLVWGLLVVATILGIAFTCGM